MSLMEGARTAVTVCMGVKSRESVLIITDDENKKIGEALFEAAREITPRVLLSVMPSTTQHGEEPQKMVRELMKTANVIFAPTTHSLTHTRARKLASKAGARIATMPGITNEMMSSGGMTADFSEIQKSIRKINTLIRNKKMVHVTTEAGTDLTFSIERRKWVLEDTGICKKKGSFTNLPAGVIFIAPMEETAEGKLVVDGSFMDILDDPVKVTIENGSATKFSGKGHKVIESLMEEASKKMKDPKIAYNVAKFGIGMNPKSRIIGNILEDEKTLGAIHIGFGGNFTLGGKIQAGVHSEAIVRDPTVEMDETMIVKKGKLLI